ncbi:MAG: outer membrane beta-barrel protein [Ignavibacteriae bacterium]|nr:outer membrane beta-barrel protein [Ignavibacteria bacterium]MBI3365354.1 outer membrane beta-barrel protein [Ignavibacteriota bacterium]
MKTLLTVCTLSLFCALPILAQDVGTGQWVVGFTGSGGIPTGDFKTGSDFGFGGGGWVGCMVSPTVTLMGKFSYMHFSGKEYLIQFNGQALNVKSSFNIMPITGAARIFLNQGESHVYLAAEAGLYISTVNVDVSFSDGGSTISGSGSSTESKFGVSPTLGALFRLGEKLDLNAHTNYTAIFTEGSTLSWINFGVGLEFALK